MSAAARRIRTAVRAVVGLTVIAVSVLVIEAAAQHAASAVLLGLALTALAVAVAVDQNRGRAS